MVRRRPGHRSALSHKLEADGSDQGDGDVRQVARYPLVLFFVLAFVATWAVWVPRAAGVPVGVLGQLWTWIPAIAAIIAAALTGGRGAVRRLLAALVRWRVGWWWYVLVIAAPAVFAGAVAGAY